VPAVPLEADPGAAVGGDVLGGGLQVLLQGGEAAAGVEVDQEAGGVAEVVYLGDVTRFLVDLDAGGRLAALQQNLETSSADVAAYRGTRVRLLWHRRHAVEVPGPR
jgi:putative spermidine/putrescine transport system ATP-binding protein